MRRFREVVLEVNDGRIRQVEHAWQRAQPHVAVACHRIGLEPGIDGLTQDQGRAEMVWLAVWAA